MKCSKHPQSEASAICIHCGAALCVACVEKTASQRIVCSSQCANALADAEESLLAIRRKTMGGHRLTGYFCCGAGVVLLGFSLIAAINQQWEWLSLQLPMALGLLVCGIFYLRLANRS